MSLSSILRYSGSDSGFACSGRTRCRYRRSLGARPCTWKSARPPASHSTWALLARRPKAPIRSAEIVLSSTSPQCASSPSSKDRPTTLAEKVHVSFLRVATRSHWRLLAVGRCHGNGPRSRRRPDRRRVGRRNCIVTTCCASTSVSREFSRGGGGGRPEQKLSERGSHAV